MSAIRGRYTLFYSLAAPTPPAELRREENFDDIIDALSEAWLIAQKGGNLTLLIYDDAALFSGDDLKEVLKHITASGVPDGMSPVEAVRKTLPQMLVKQLVKTVKVAHEHFGAVAVYRSLLEDLYEAANQALQKKDLALLCQITGKMAFGDVPSEHDVKQWGKDFLHAYRRDAGWLHDTKQALEKIKAAVEKMEVAEGSPNAELKAQILKAAEDGLIAHV